MPEPALAALAPEPDDLDPQVDEAACPADERFSLGAGNQGDAVLDVGLLEEVLGAIALVGTGHHAAPLFTRGTAP